MPKPLRSSGKAFYVMLCAILGVMLFVVIQRAFSLIYYLLLNTNFKTYSFGLDYYQLSWINFLSMLAAVFFGLWYGVWLGLHWYDMVYEEGSGGVWQHIKQHWPRREELVKQKPAPVAQPGSLIQAPASVTIKPTLRTSDISPKLSHKSAAEGWDLDDLLKKDAVIEAAVQAVTKPKVKKPAAKRKVAPKKPAEASA
jgi:hypothetical protein